MHNDACHYTSLIQRLPHRYLRSRAVHVARVERALADGKALEHPGEQALECQSGSFEDEAGLSRRGVWQTTSAGQNLRGKDARLTSIPRP
jgi:hypothetical protein